MLTGLPHKTKQFFFVLIKLSIVVGAGFFIYKKLTTNTKLDFTVFIDYLNTNSAFSIKTISFLLILTLFNWFFEILKWQNLVSFIKQISFFDALKQSLASHTASLFTPNRIGDYGAKAVFFKSTLRKRVVLLNLMSNLAQMFATIVFGVIGLGFFITKYNVEISHFKLFSLLAIITITSVLFVVVITNNKIRIKGFSMTKIRAFITSIPVKIHTKTILFSLLRYCIFSFQFYYLLSIFGTDLNFLDAMVFITSMYLLTSIIPTIFIFDVVIKGSVALYLFEFSNISELTILSTIMLMWLLNFVLPSVFGGLFVLNFDYYKETDNLKQLEN